MGFATKFVDQERKDILALQFLDLLPAWPNSVGFSPLVLKDGY